MSVCKGSLQDTLATWLLRDPRACMMKYWNMMEHGPEFDTLFLVKNASLQKGFVKIAILRVPLVSARDH